jgi:hypothetical protein
MRTLTTRSLGSGSLGNFIGSPVSGIFYVAKRALHGMDDTGPPFLLATATPLHADEAEGAGDSRQRVSPANDSDHEA